MTSRLPARYASVVLVLFLGNAYIPANAQGLSAKELKRAVKQADNAIVGGRYDRALELYDQIINATSGTDPRRGEALYASAMIRLSSAAGADNATWQDVEAARRNLEAAAAFPGHARRLEIAVVRALFSGLDSARAEVKASAAELAAKTAEHRQAAAERAEAAGESEAAGGRVKSLESQLRRIRSELSECRAELEQKEQALQKLRDALVAGAG